MSSLNPKVAEFKAFVEKHPKLIDHVRQSNEGWQPYYEKWILYGEDDDYWLQFRDTQETNTKNQSEGINHQEMFHKLSNMVNNMDLNKLQEQMNQLNGVITNVQSVIQQFQQQNPQNSHIGHEPNRRNPFKFGKD